MTRKLRKCINRIGINMLIDRKAIGAIDALAQLDAARIVAHAIIMHADIVRDPDGSFDPLATFNDLDKMVNEKKRDITESYADMLRNNPKTLDKLDL